MSSIEYRYGNDLDLAEVIDLYQESTLGERPPGRAVATNCTHERAVSPSPGPSGHPLPVGDDCMDAGGRATQGAVAEGKSARPPAAGSWVGGRLMTGR